MSLPKLTIIPAGAGSGKTHTIQEQLGEWVAAGAVGPDRIVAVTFTEAAASELKERIGTQLLGMGRVDDALRLDQAYISTIHGFGLRLLTEFAFESGSSPQPRLLNEDEQNALIRLALSRTDKTDDITRNLAAYGYAYEHASGKSAEDMFRDDLLRIIELLRSVAWRSCDESYATLAVEWITERYGRVVDDTGLSGALRQSVEALLNAYPESLERDCGTSKAAAEAFQNDYRNLRRALSDQALETDWQLWQKLREMRQSKRGSPLPEDYEQLSSAVIAAANALPHHPGPLAHAQRHIKALLSAGQDVLLHYAAAKREAGLVDYSDMIAMAGQLLRDRPEVLSTLVQRVDCLVVDEFQDTNPLQFALLWQLAAAGVPTIVVGDLKQAIMGFQGADPRLFGALEQQNAAVCKPLTRNWRSQPHLMEFVNALGPGLFGDAYIALAPQREASDAALLEVVSFPKKAKKDQHAIRAASIGKRLSAFLNDANQQIVDRRTGQARRPRGADIAVLCPINSMLATYANILRAQGLRVRLQADGWYASRAVQIVRHALAYLTNPADRHAALYLAVTELGSLSLQEALQQLMDAGCVAEPLLAGLDALAEGVQERTVYALVADTIATLQLWDTVARWGDGEQERANLLRLLAEAGEFMDANREALASGGFHGAGVQTFLAWLNARVEAKNGDKQPEPRVLDEDAIVLATWHSAKGREWPIVAVCGLDRAVSARLPDVGLGYRSFEDLSDLLSHARIEYAPRFAAPEASDRFLAELDVHANTEARRVLYVALTRARDKLLLEWPDYVARGKTVTYWSVLAGECQLTLTDTSLNVGDAELSCAVIEGLTEFPEDIDLTVGSIASELPIFGRLAVHPGAVPADLTPDSRTASAMVGASADTVVRDVTGVEVIRYGEALHLAIELAGTALGTFLHRCFEVLGVRPDLVTTMPTVTGVTVTPQVLSQVASAVERFEAWMQGYFNVMSVRREWPLLALDENGSVISGTADLIVQTQDGVWIIDHKSDQIEDPVQSFLDYEPQLLAYAMILAGSGETVAGIAIHWIRRSEVVMKAIPRTEHSSSASSPKRKRRH